MAFLAIKIQYDTIKREMNQKNYELDLASRKLEYITSQLKDLKATNSEKDLAKSDAYKDLVAYEMAYDTRKGSLESELELLKNEESAYKQALAKNIKSSFSWSCFGK